MEKQKKLKEADLARRLIVWLKDMRWTVYQEVYLGPGNPVVDIVCVRDKIIWMIETKTSLSLALLEQAYNHIGRANYISVCIPRRVISHGIRKQHSKGSVAAKMFLRDYGIGMIEVECNHHEPFFPDDLDVREKIRPRLNRRDKFIRDVTHFLTDKQQIYAEAGNSDNKYWTPFKQTADELRSYVKKNPGATLKEVIESINHHYATPASAKNSLAKWIREGIIGELVLKQEGRQLCVYPDNHKPLMGDK